MATAAGGDGDGNRPPPNKKPRICGADPPVKNLNREYMKILEFMYEYHAVYHEFPTVASYAEFYRLVRDNARAIAGYFRFSPQRLTRVMQFMEETYWQTVQDRGINANFSNEYLQERFELSRGILGDRDQLNRDRELGNLQSVLVLEDRPRTRAAQEVMDIAILRALIEFRDNRNYGRIPPADSVNFFIFASRFPNLRHIQPDRLFDRILILEENFRNPIQIGELGAAENPRTLEIRNFSEQIWGVGNAGDGQEGSSGLGSSGVGSSGIDSVGDSE